MPRHTAKVQSVLAGGQGLQGGSGPSRGVQQGCPLSVSGCGPPRWWHHQLPGTSTFTADWQQHYTPPCRAGGSTTCREPEGCVKALMLAQTTPCSSSSGVACGFSTTRAGCAFSAYSQCRIHTSPIQPHLHIVRHGGVSNISSISLLGGCNNFLRLCKGAYCLSLNTSFTGHCESFFGGSIGWRLS